MEKWISFGSGAGLFRSRISLGQEVGEFLPRKEKEKARGSMFSRAFAFVEEFC